MTPNPTASPLTHRSAWTGLAAHHRDIREVHLRSEFANSVRGGLWTGHTGKPIRTVIQGRRQATCLGTEMFRGGEN